MLGLFRMLFPIYFDAAGDGGSGGGGAGGSGDGGAGDGGAGGSDDGKGGKDDAAGDGDDDDDDLGEAGQKALAEERRARRAAEKTAKATKAELDKLKADAMSEQDKAVATAKAEGRTEALSVADERLVRAAVTTAATGKITTPSLASKLLDLDEFEVDDDGEVDEKAIAKAIDQLVKEHPELANGTPKPGSLKGAKGGTPSTAGSMNDWIRDQAGVSAS